MNDPIKNHQFKVTMSRYISKYTLCLHNKVSTWKIHQFIIFFVSSWFLNKLRLLKSQNGKKSVINGIIYEIHMTRAQTFQGSKIYDKQEKLKLEKEKKRFFRSIWRFLLLWIFYYVMCTCVVHTIQMSADTKIFFFDYLI